MTADTPQITHCSHSSVRWWCWSTKLCENRFPLNRTPHSKGDGQRREIKMIWTLAFILCQTSALETWQLGGLCPRSEGNWRSLSSNESHVNPGGLTQPRLKEKDQIVERRQLLSRVHAFGLRAYQRHHIENSRLVRTRSANRKQSEREGLHLQP